MVAQSAAGFHPAFVLLALGVLISAWVWRCFNLRRACQVFSTVLFFALFWLASYAGRPDWPVALYLYTDPLLAGVLGLAGRVLVPLTLFSLIFVGLAAALGRVFCSHLCPLGVLFDLSDRWLGRRQKARANRRDYARTRRTKYVLLLVLVGAAGAGFDLLGWADPLVLFTRFSASLFYPVCLAVGDVALQALRPLAVGIDWTALAYAELSVPSFEGAIGSLALLLGLVLLARLQPRFWCRHLCPLGGLLGALGHFAPYRRRVGPGCTNCDTCTRSCPTGAIHSGGQGTDRRECIVCRACVRQCPEGAVRFGFARELAEQDAAGPRLSRRGFAGSLVGGLAVGLAFRADADHPVLTGRPVWRPHDRLIRPPGALPEPEFLSRCVRCGECLKACLTNTLQPDWYRAGLEGLWAPRLNLRRAHCEHSCNLCGQVCPTGAIRDLSLIEKQHAKIGTAVIRRHTCLAWAEDRRCQICDEVCPYHAIYVHREPNRKVGLPVVDTSRCVGCGTCEEKCPVGGEADIVVVAHGEFRFAAGSYVAEARARGFNFTAQGNLPDQMFVEPGAPSQAPSGPGADPGLPQLPPGIEAGPDEQSALPPGIDTGEEG